MSSRSSIGLSLLCLVLWTARPNDACGHAYVDSSVPADGAVLEKTPSEVRIRFTEGVEIEFSTIVVKGPAGERNSAGKVRRLAGDTLAVDVKPLAPGSYSIEWQVLSVDTHITEGVLRFTVRPESRKDR